MAQTVGYDHELVQSYDDDLVAWMRYNGGLSRGIAPPADEVMAWRHLRDRVAGSANPVLLVGDHFLGDNAIRRAHHGSKPVGRMRQFDRLRWLARHLPRGLYERFDEGVAADLAQVLERGGGPGNRGYYFFDQRLPNTVVPWRQSFPGRYMRVRWPLLDYDLLDWSMMVPPEVRARCIYQVTAERAFPRAFQVPRATSAGYYPPFRAHILKQARALRAEARKSGSRLEEVLPLDVGAALLDEAARKPTQWRRVRRKLAARVGTAQIRLRQRLKQPPVGRMVAPAKALRHYLVLKEALVPRRGG